MKKISRVGLALAAALLLAPSLYAGERHGDGAFFVAPHDGATVSSPVVVSMGVQGMTAVKAGSVEAGKGHHHLIVDGHFVAKGEAVAKDASHHHFGKGQTKTSLKLTAGYHTLTLQFADGHHRSYGGAWSQTIQILVK